MLDTKHYLDIYKVRKRMFEEGVTNPIPVIKDFIIEIVEKLSTRDPNEKIDLLKNEKLTDLLYKWNALSEIRKTRMLKLDEWANNHMIPYLLTKISFKEIVFLISIYKLKL